MTQILEPITGGTAYPLEVFFRMTGWGRDSLRKARRKGLRVRYAGGRGFVMGTDFLAYLDKHGEDEYPSQQRGAEADGE
ncbi:hypothetical protein [Thalassoroseus pseudoceratinae]|uniref:hypothetical protein n=1 Tax=Thalassoroseus pseudoceratinae TaxID=2713176 RepID=UPI00142162B0|nr:hypothetical protein [Thalassoroseus pseudoceratinae]